LPHFGVHTPYEAKPDKRAHFRQKTPAGGHHDPTYAAMISSVDDSVGRVLARLDELGLSANTLVIFASDNGGVGGYRAAGVKTREGVTDNSPLRGGKGMLYEGGVRVPFIFRWPGRIKPGTVCDEPIISVDLFPTLIELTQAKRPQSQPLDGVSLLPVLFDQSPTLKREALYWHFPGYLGSGHDVWRTTPAGAIRVGNFKLLEFFEDGRLELYDVRADVSQKHDLAGDKPDVVRTLHAQLKAWRESIHAPMPARRTNHTGRAVSSTRSERTE
jgi:arylsulfatase A-like enzyme